MTDEHNRTEIVNLGSIKAVRGPNELAAGLPYVISFDYHSMAEYSESGINASAYAVTRHDDIQHPNDHCYRRIG